MFAGTLGIYSGIRLNEYSITYSVYNNSIMTEIL